MDFTSMVATATAMNFLYQGDFFYNKSTIQQSQITLVGTNITKQLGDLFGGEATIAL